MKKNLFTILFSLPMLLTACGSDTPEIQDTISIKSCYIVRSNNLSESFASPMGLYILDNVGQAYDPVSYKNSASLVSDKWTFSTPVYVTGAGSLYAYYPYGVTDTPPTLSIYASDQVDLLYTKNPTTFSSGGASSLTVKLYHAMSQLIVSVKDEEVVELSLNSPLTANFNITTGAYSELSYGKSTISGGEMLVIPHTATGTELSIKLATGTKYTYSIDGMTFTSGESYAYEFTLNDNREQLEIASISVEDWSNDFTHKDYLKK